MARYDTGTDDRRVRVRPPKSSRPRTKRRPDYSEEPLGRIVGIDRGRYAVALESPEVQPAQDDTVVVAIKARELPRGSVVIGDLVRLTGDLTGRKDTLARIVQVESRRNALRRSLEEAADTRGEKTIVANADLMVIVVAAASPQPRSGMVERALVAANEAGIPALLCITKTDLADPSAFLGEFAGFDLDTIETTVEAEAQQGLGELGMYLRDKFSVLIGHSGVGKSTLINALVDGADRTVGRVNEVTGKGRHTSTNAVALALPNGGWIVDTPGMRSFGLGHVQPEHVLQVFPGLAEAAEHCMPNCTHEAGEVDCALDKWSSEHGSDPVPGPELVARARSLLLAVQTKKV